MFWRAIKNAKLLRNPELVLPFCLRLGQQKVRPHCQQAVSGDHPVRDERLSERNDPSDVLSERR
jgi:hypothetical protein